MGNFKEGKLFSHKKEKDWKYKKGQHLAVGTADTKAGQRQGRQFIVLNIDWAIQTFDQVEPKPRSET